MKILIYESEHYETMFTLIQLWNLQGNTIVLAIDKKLESYIEDFLSSIDILSEIRVEIIPEKRSKRFLAIRKAILQHLPDLYFINTISNNHFLHALLLLSIPINQTVITIHDINSFFRPPTKPSLKDFLNYIGRQLIIKDKRIIFNILDDTLYPTLNQYIENRHTVIQIPGGLARKSNFLTVTNHSTVKNIPLQIVVPGSVDNRRRDYITVEKVIICCQKQNLDIHFTLLGAPYDKTDENFLKRLKQTDFLQERITIFQEPVPQPKFDKIMKRSDLLLFPTKLRFMNKGIEEVYGISKCSGNIGDAIRFSKPFICPSTLQISPHLAGSFYRYMTPEDIVNVIRQVITMPGTLQQIKEKAEENSSFYTPEAVRNRNPDLFRS